MKTSRNFTLIELLVAIGLLMVIVWLVTMAFNNTSKVSQDVTASLDYHAKGRAILDAITNDITASVQVAGQDYNTANQCGDQCDHFGAVVHLPRMDTRYETDATNWGEKQKSMSDVVGVRWQFDRDKNMLYRKVYGVPAPTLTTIESDITTPFSASDNTDALTYPDIRGFKIEPSKELNGSIIGYSAGEPAASGSGIGAPNTIPNYYTVSFWLTNAPKSVAGTPAGGGTAEQEPYTWIYFTRQISTR